MYDDIYDNEIISVMSEDTIKEVEHEQEQEINNSTQDVIREEPIYMYDDISGICDIIDKAEPEQEQEP